MTFLESNLYWRKRRQTILQSLNAQPTSDLTCTCTHALSTSNSSTCSSCTPLIKTPENATSLHSCTCKHLGTSPGKCRLCRMSPSRTKISHSPVKMNGHATFENISSQYPCQHQGLVPNIKIFDINRSFFNLAYNSPYLLILE